VPASYIARRLRGETPVVTVPAERRGFMGRLFGRGPLHELPSVFRRRNSAPTRASDFRAGWRTSAHSSASRICWRVAGGDHLITAKHALSSERADQARPRRSDLDPEIDAR
jgi:hypothetical protein